MASTQEKPPIQIRPVWRHNLEAEMSLIWQASPYYTFAAIDTEFPGAVHHPHKQPFLLSPEERYSLLKSNVDDLSLIQLGLTLADPDGNLPDLAWEFNVSDFDIHSQPYALDSVQLLIENGLDLERIHREGVSSAILAMYFRVSGLFRPTMNWVTFHGEYDFGYLVKMMSESRRLPDSLPEFMAEMRGLFGERVYDVKLMIRDCKLYGGLERVAGSLNIRRLAGACHNAGSDSLLTSHAFLQLTRQYCFQMEKYAGGIYGYVKVY